MPTRKRPRNAAEPPRSAAWERSVERLGRFLRWGMPCWVLLLLVGVGTAWAQRYMEGSPAFTLQRIHEPALADWRRTVSLERTSLLHVNVAAVASQLRETNPHMKFIRVTRRWPADLIIEAVPRQPVAQLRLRDFVPVDDEGFVFAAGTTAPAAALPVIEGVESMGQRVLPGAVTTVARLHVALRVLQTLRAAPGLRGETVALLNVADPHQLTCRLQRGIEVRLGEAEELPNTLERLGPVLAKLRNSQLTPQYIDLRFADPVIGPR